MWYTYLKSMKCNIAILYFTDNPIKTFLVYIYNKFKMFQWVYWCNNQEVFFPGAVSISVIL